MSSISERDFDKAAALAAYKEKLKAEAATQNLSQDLRDPARNLSIAFTIVAAVFVGLRFAARYRKQAQIGMDDWLMVGALVLLVGNMAFNLACRFCLAAKWPLTVVLRIVETNKQKSDQVGRRPALGSLKYRRDCKTR